MTLNAAFPLLIIIPTTAGNGAEIESTAMITDTTHKMKWRVWHAELKQAFVMLDTEIAICLPANLTA